MPDTGFLGGAPAEQAPNPLEVPQAPGEAVDEYAAAEREAQKEMAAEQQEDTFLERAAEVAPTTAVTTQTQGQAQSAPAAAPVVKDEVTTEVEKILEDGLGEYIPDMPDEARDRFIQKGGEVAGQLSVMVRTLNVQVTIVIELIKEWLLTIPGVNRYFIEQESKIKTDRIIALADERRKGNYGVSA